MKKTLLSLAIASLAAGQSVCAAVEKVYNEPDSVYIFSYAHPEDEGRSGLKFACLLYTSPSPRDKRQSRMPSSA